MDRAFDNCFHSYSIRRFLEEGLLLPDTPNSADVSPECKEAAINYTRGQMRSLPSHNTHNIEDYEKEFLFYSEYRNTHAKTPARLLAIHTETMQEDFENLNILFQTGSLRKKNTLSANATGISVANQGHLTGTGGQTFNYTSIPQHAYGKLCYHLCQDIQAYKRFLYRSANLDDEHVLARIYDLNHYCPLETMELRKDCGSFR